MNSSGNDAPGPAARFHLAIWRWHFYAGVCVIPLLFLLALSALGMLASEPVDRYLQRELLVVTPDSGRLSGEDLAASVAAAYPHSTIATYRPALARDESARFVITPGHDAADHAGHGNAGGVTVFIDPYTGAILGERGVDDSFYAWAKQLHGTLLLGTTGDYIIEIAAGFGILLIVTGVYLWWPRQGRALRTALLPGTSSATRRRWRDWHGAIGIWIAPFLLFFFVSGLAWTPFWGGELVQSWSSLPGETFNGPLSPATHASLDHGAHQEVPWALEQTPLPASGSQGTPGIVSASRVTLNDVVGYARVSGFEGFRIHWPQGEQGVWTIASTTMAGDTRDLDGDRIIHLDPVTGNVLAEIGFADYSPMGKMMAAGIPLHQADTGLINLVVNVVLCLGVLGLGGAAVAAWWTRRPAGTWRLAPPPLPRDPGTWRSAVVLMLGLSLLFPLAAATIATVLVIDWLLLSRVRAVDTLIG